jgi:hypothetical protein
LQLHAPSYEYNTGVIGSAVISEQERDRNSTKSPSQRFPHEQSYNLYRQDPRGMATKHTDEFFADLFGED